MAQREVEAVNVPPTLNPKEAKNEVELAEAMSTSLEMALAIVAFDAFLKSCGDYSECLRGALSSLRIQTNITLRSNLVTALVRTFPNNRDAIVEEVRSHGIEVLGY